VLTRAEGYAILQEKEESGRKRKKETRKNRKEEKKRATGQKIWTESKESTKTEETAKA